MATSPDSLTARVSVGTPSTSSLAVGLAGLAALLVAACSVDTVPVGPGTTAAAPTTTTATTVPAVPLSGLSATVVADDLVEPVDVIAAPDGERLWVVERPGRIVAVDPADPHGSVDVVLDIRDEVLADGPEQGLLSVALHPDYPEHGGAFVYLVTAGDDDTELREYAPYDDDPGVLDPRGFEVVLAVDQPHEWHNGGSVVFGPDGYLYLGLGDGGGIADRYENGQDADTILGGIVRIDVDAADPYAIPPDNPYVDGGGAPELWSHGLRNPWRIALDAATGTMVIADVGQDQWEDINIVPLTSGGGTNFGWPVIAGPECFQSRADREEGLPAPVCDPDEFHTPTLSLDRSDGCAVIGGPVYRGVAIPELSGHYVYSDYCRGSLRSFPLDEVVAGAEVVQTEHLVGLGRITSVGTDHRGELYLTDQEGTLQRIDPIRAAPSG